MTSGNPTAILSFDFDGTLVDRPSDPYEIARLESCLVEMQERGAVWGINTGRTLFHTLDGLKEHGFRQRPDFIIARECEIYTLNNVGRWVDLGDWNQRCSADHRKFYTRHAAAFGEIARYAQRVLPGVKFISDAAEPAGLVAQDDALMEQMCQWLEGQRAQWPELNWQRNSIWLRFTHEGYDKGSALMEVRRVLGIGAAFTFAAGDNFNDLPMLRPEVAHGLACPANAIPEVAASVAGHGGYHASADCTTGVIEALQHFFYQE